MALTSFKQLVDPRRHFDHKAAGVLYVATFAFQTYLILTSLEYYESGFLPHLLAPFIGIFVCLTALRNFKFLSRSKENPGMFAHKRTFSRSFVIENLWFQFVGVTVMLLLHPPCRRFLTPWGCFAVFSALYYSRELFPKTSYVSWEKGNKEINKMKGKDSWSVWFINLQVKLVRLNFVFKKYYGIYLVLCATMEVRTLPSSPLLLSICLYVCLCALRDSCPQPVSPSPANSVSSLFTIIAFYGAQHLMLVQLQS